MSPRLIYTVGHSNRALSAFVDLLVAANIRTLLDVRAYPGSKRHPYYARARLEARLSVTEITYGWMGDTLGGKRPPQPDSPHLALAPSVRGFADYMQTSVFKAAIDDLLARAAQWPTAIMCAEKQPVQCHRALIADYLMCQGVKVMHLIEGDEHREHQLTPTVRKTSRGLIYDRHVTAPLGFL